MDIKVLETFIAVADAGSVSSAASILGISQPIISRRIKELEADCRTALLYRHGRGVKLTEAGESLCEAIRPLVLRYSDIVAGLAEKQTRPAGTVTVALSPSFLSAAGIGLLDAMRDRYPDVRLRLVSGYSRYIYEWLLQARVEIGVLSDIGLSAPMLLEDLGSVPVVLAARADLRLPPASAGHVELADIAHLPLVLPSQGQGLRRHIDIAASKANVKLQIAYEIDDIALTRELVAAGRGATLLPRYAVYREVMRGEFAERRVGIGNFRARSVLATARNHPVTPAMRAAIEVVKEVARATFEKYA